MLSSGLLGFILAENLLPLESRWAPELHTHKHTETHTHRFRYTAFRAPFQTHFPGGGTSGRAFMTICSLLWLGKRKARAVLFAVVLPRAWLNAKYTKDVLWKGG